MRAVTVTAHHFQSFLYPFLASSVARDAAEWDVALRVLKKVKEPSLVEEIPLTQVEQEARRAGKPVYPGRKLREDSATFLLEEDEYQLIRQRLQGFKTSVFFGAADDFAELLAAVEEAPNQPVAAVEG